MKVSQQSEIVRGSIRGAGAIRGTFSITSSAGRSTCRVRSMRSKKRQTAKCGVIFVASRGRRHGQCSRGAEAIDCFPVLPAGEPAPGCPSPPLSFFRKASTEVFAQRDSIEVWFAFARANASPRSSSCATAMTCMRNGRRAQPQSRRFQSLDLHVDCRETAPPSASSLDFRPHRQPQPRSVALRARARRHRD